MLGNQKYNKQKQNRTLMFFTEKIQAFECSRHKNIQNCQCWLDEGALNSFFPL